jgi:hypothetical protein
MWSYALHALFLPPGLSLIRPAGVDLACRSAAVRPKRVVRGARLWRSIDCFFSLS